MKKITFILLSLFLITGCGDDSSSGKSTTTRSNRTLENSRFGNSDCRGFNDCSLNRGGFVSGNTTETPFSVGQTLGFTDNIRLGLEFYADNPSHVEAVGQMEVLSTGSYSVDCRMPHGLYEIRTVRGGSVGANANHEYQNIELEARNGRTIVNAVLLHSQSVNFGDNWALNAQLQLLAVDGRSCGRFGNIVYSFSFQTR